MDTGEAAARSMLLLGALLTILGVGTYALAAYEPAPSFLLVPAFFGAFFVAIGMLARRRVLWHRTLLYAAVGLALLTIAFTLDGVALSAELISGQPIDHPARAVEGAVASALCFWFVGMSVVRLVRRQGLAEHA